MRIILDIKKFNTAVHTVARFAERRAGTLPVLSSILLVAGGDGIKLRATNLETGIDLALDGEKKTEGVVAIPAAVLSQLTNSFLGAGTLELEHSGDTLHISSQNTKTTLKTVPYEDFPPIPFLDNTPNHITLPGATIKTLFTAIASCASTSSVRPELASILLSLQGTSATFTATDSFRLVEKKTALTKNAPAAKILIPAKNAIDIAQALPDSEVQIFFDEHQATLSFEGGKIMTRLTNATYPDYAQIIPKDVAAEAVILRQEFEQALKRTIIFSDAFQKIRIGFEQKKQQLTLSARNQEVGESNDAVAGQISGAALELSFNHRYLAAALGLTGSEKISLSAAGIGRPLVIRGAGDNSFLYLVSPMNQ